MQHTTSVINVLVGGLLVLGLAGYTEAKEVKYRERVAGTFTDTPIDTNGDGTTATVSRLTGKVEELGRITGESVIEYEPTPLFPGDPPNNCPQVDLAGSPEVQVEFTFVAGAGVKTFRRGDQLLLSPTSSLLCINPATGAGFFQNTGNFIGGTGRFVGASGTFETTGTVATLLLNADFTPGFGITQFEIDGTLTLP